MAAVLLTLGGTWKMTRKAQGFVKCAGDLHPSFSGLACIPWSSRRPWFLCVKAEHCSQTAMKSNVKALWCSRAVITKNCSVS